MFKEDPYHVKFEALQPWVIEIFSSIKKEIKNEHLKKNPALIQKYFTKKTADKLTIEEITHAYLEELKLDNEEIGDWVTSHWVLKNSEMYQFYAESLKAINPKFEEIESIPADRAEKMLDLSLQEFGAAPTYIFCILNSVKFSSDLYQRLREMAIKETMEKEEISPKSEAIESPEALKKRHEQEILKLTDKYEKKLLGVQKKYFQDVEGLKKQIAALQRKLQELCGR